MGIKKIAVWIVIVLVIGLFFAGMMMSIIADKKCKTICKEEGTTVYNTISNGEWNINDACICYFPNKYEMFIIK